MPILGTLWGCGYNKFGQLGLGDTVDRSSLTQVGTDSDWKTIDASLLNSSMIKLDGTLWACGYNGQGQLGIGFTADRSIPTQAGTMAGWAQVSGSYRTEVMLQNDGTLWGAGTNPFGQLGSATLGANSISPIEIDTGTNWAQAASGWQHTVAIKTDGTMWACGYGGHGMLGTGSTTNVTTIAQVGSDSNWSHVACGYDTTAAIKTDGTLWTCGYNNHGQLGLGNITDQSLAVQVGTSADWSQIACGYAFMSGIKTDGSLWLWGQNAYGQLGQSDTLNRSTPVQLGTSTDWSSVSCGFGHILATKTDGSLWGWGYNNKGQLGQNNNENYSSPVQLGTATGWTMVSAGYTHSLALPGSITPPPPPPPPATPFNTSAPVVTGIPVTGQTLTTDNGTWSDSPSSYTYKWQQDYSTDIAGATGSTYVLQSSDIGHLINSEVTAINGAGSAASQSNRLGPVSAPLSNGRPLYAFANPTVAVSADNGITWVSTGPDFPGFNIISSANNGVDTIIATADLAMNLHLLSTDSGATWRTGTFPIIDDWSCVVANTSIFVAFGQTNVIYSSTDGIDWTERTNPIAFWPLCAAYGNGKFVALVNGSDSYLTSVDGITWLARTNNQLGINNFQYGGITFDGSRFIAVSAGDPSNVLTSLDGITWTDSSMQSLGYTFGPIASSLNVVVSIPSPTGSYDTFQYSTDGGQNWTTVSPPAGAQIWSSITWNGQEFAAVAIGASANTILNTSPDGANWYSYAMPTGQTWCVISSLLAPLTNYVLSYTLDEQIIPTCILQYSDDGGATWSDEIYCNIGGPGQYNTRVMFYSLGVSRNRVFKITDINNAYAGISGGELVIDLALT